jgi:hypothetical protein
MPIASSFTKPLSTTACTGSTGSNALCDEAFSFDNFIVAFEGLVGKHGTLSTPEMQQFTDFALQLTMPPNPVANLDGTQTAAQASGENLYFNHPSDAGQTCNFCHTLDPAAGFFGTGGDQSEEGETQRFKVAHLRNMYQKVGMFGIVTVTPFAGGQVRGFGFLHDGSVDTMFTFLDQGPFALNTTQVAELEQFMLAFPSDVAPIVGQQVSIGPGSPGSFVSADVNGRIATLDARGGTAFGSFVLGGSVTECDLVVKSVEAGAPRSYLRQGDGTYLPDDGGSAISEVALRAKGDPVGDAQDLHYACVPPGSGPRMGLDRDEDAVHNGLDNCPAWPNGAGAGTCTAGDAALLGARCAANGACGGGGVCSQAQEDGDSDGTGDACEPLLLPEPGAAIALALGAAFLFSRRRRHRA